MFSFRHLYFIAPFIYSMYREYKIFFKHKQTDKGYDVTTDIGLVLNNENTVIVMLVIYMIDVSNSSF